MDAREIKQGLIWGCDSSPPLNKNLVPRIKTWGKKTEGVRANMIFTIQVALHKNVDSITIFVSMSCSENFNQHDNERKGKTLKWLISWSETLKHLSSWDTEHTARGMEWDRWQRFTRWTTIFTLKKVVNSCQRSEELSCHDTITRHLRDGDS